MGVPVFDPAADVGFQLLDRVVMAALQKVFGYVGEEPSLDSLNPSVRWGLRLNPFQIRPIVDLESPLRSAIFFRDQWVACSGVDSRVATTTSSTCSAVIVGLRPERGSSTNPSSRDSTNRDRHLPTVGIETPSCAATSLLVRPLAQAKTIRERNARACADFLHRNLPVQLLAFIRC